MRKNVRGQPQVLFALFFETGSQIYQSWLASKPQESACLHLPRAELTIAFKHSHLLNIDSWARTQVLDLAEQDLNWLDHLPSPASDFYLYGFFASQLTCLLRSSIRESSAGPLLSHLICIKTSLLLGSGFSFPIIGLPWSSPDSPWSFMFLLV